MARGGRRPGSGRKPKKLGVVVGAIAPPTTNGAPSVEEFDAPDSLLADERAIWLKQAPYAFTNRTLTRASAMAFERYCKVAALEWRIAQTADVGKADHRGLLKQINAYELQFLLAPCGKPLPQAAPKVEAEPESKLARFRRSASA